MNTSNLSEKDHDLALWYQYKTTNDLGTRNQLMRRLTGLINSTASKWAGPVPKDVLVTEGNILAVKALDTYDPSKGTALSTHIVNNLAPLSRIVYTYQNTARVPENIALKISTFNQAMDHLTTLYGRKPTVDELHSFTGFPAKELSKLQTMGTKDLVESAGVVGGDFYSNKEDADEDAIFALYNSLTPEEKDLFSYTTGKYTAKKLSNPEIMDKMHLTQSQLSYKKLQLRDKLDRLAYGVRPK